uniref:Immunoglobulin domain-containing protein n=1 Tax=Cyprinus carpio TaxID=7962 RepID=A0A8C1XTM4_CYPCA
MERQNSGHNQIFTELVVDKRSGNMVNAFALFCLCLCPLVDVMDAVRRISVMKGDSVTLNADVTEVQKYLLIQWMFGSTRIAEFNRLTQTISIYDSADGRFKDRLKLDLIGSLTITNTRTTDSGLYKLIIVSEETIYKSFNLTVYETPQNSTSSESSSASNPVTSSSVVNKSTVNQTENNNSTDLHQPSSDNIHCCSFTEAVIRLVLSALVGVATVAVLVYDIRSTRSELIRTEETKHYHQTHVKSDQQYELSRRMSSVYVQI